MIRATGSSIKDMEAGIDIEDIPYRIKTTTVCLG